MCIFSIGIPGVILLFLLKFGRAVLFVRFKIVLQLLSIQYKFIYSCLRLNRKLKRSSLYSYLKRNVNFKDNVESVCMWY